MQIGLKNTGVLEVEIVDFKGEPTGEKLVFDTLDIELPFKMQEMFEKHEGNIKKLKADTILLEKKKYPASKKKSLFTQKQQDEFKLMRDFYNKEMETMDVFLGEGGCKKMLNGRKPYLTMFNDITEALEPVMKELASDTGDIVDKIKSKYQEDEGETLE